MNKLLALSAIIEAVTGVALIAVPAIVVRLLLGAEISGASMPLRRVAGSLVWSVPATQFLSDDGDRTPLHSPKVL